MMRIRKEIFPMLSQDQLPTAEIVKCYIDSNYRRLGIGTILFNQALRFCNDVGYEKIYLHTHLFLPGAIPFWKAKGFEERLAEDNPVWNTVHMDRKM
ncbi:GNAT family N-acetyltransferase [Metabacillus litoralis]|jgi:GNAT superfamily N-acetyltransferase|nr:GNAT family N-acetyltransferase [Metabacillus litoralis]